MANISAVDTNLAKPLLPREGSSSPSPPRRQGKRVSSGTHSPTGPISPPRDQADPIAPPRDQADLEAGRSAAGTTTGDLNLDAEFRGNLTLLEPYHRLIEAIKKRDFEGVKDNARRFLGVKSEKIREEISNKIKDIVKARIFSYEERETLVEELRDKIKGEDLSCELWRQEVKAQNDCNRRLISANFGITAILCVVVFLTAVADSSSKTKEILHTVIPAAILLVNIAFFSMLLGRIGRVPEPPTRSIQERTPVPPSSSSKDSPLEMGSANPTPLE